MPHNPTRENDPQYAALRARLSQQNAIRTEVPWRCDLCHKRAAEVRKLLQIGPATLCNDCIAAAHELCQE